MPTSTENLKATITQFKTIQSQTATPAYLFAEISKALADFPQVEIASIDWRAGREQKDAVTKAAAPKAGTPAPAPPNAPATATAASAGYELATVSAQVVGARRTDLRSITNMTNQFIDALGKRPGLEVTDIRMPFDLGLATKLAGDIGSERTIAEDAQFTVIIGRKLGK